MKKHFTIYIFIISSLFIILLFNVVNYSFFNTSYLEQNKSNIKKEIGLQNLFFNSLKNNIIIESNNLCDIDYYTKALNLIDLSSSLLKEDEDLILLKQSIEDRKKRYLSTKHINAVSTSTSILNNISIATINALSIESITSYLIQVDIKNQKTYIYNGSKNRWNLLKSFVCSTGINGQNTPKGVYTIKERGKWFFSEKYNQGGKYWVQFIDDYLFHSVPYNKEQSKVLDTTLGVPSSHGCIRLSEHDAKWIYDNIPFGSKVIIN